MTEPQAALDNLLTENRTFPPSEEFAAQANATAALYDEADADREAFWAKQAERIVAHSDCPVCGGFLITYHS